VRALRSRRVPRPDMAPGCPERLDLEFLRWIWGYPRTRRPRVLELLADFERAGGTAVVLRNRNEIESFLRSTGERAG